MKASFSSLDRKLLRDLWSLKTQVISVALVIACGIGGFVGSLSTHRSLVQARDRYYDSARFAHVFATAKRAPAPLAERLRALPGVSEVETRIVRDAQLSVPDVATPMIARLVGYDFARPAALNRLVLTRGRWPAAGGEAVVNQRFLEARRLALGSPVSVLLNGKFERLTLVGTVLSPEFILPTRGGGLPDDEWFAVIWLDRAALAAAFDMEGAFNSVLLRLARDASLPDTLHRVDAVLERHGGFGAIGRDEQLSHKLLTQEINQQRIFGTVLPAVFLLVAAFILNVVLHRQVAAQRGAIAALKALGYEDRRIGLHYLEFTAVIVALGIALGAPIGAWFGAAMTELYTRFFHFPAFRYAFPLELLALAGLCALAAACAGALAAIRGVVRLKAAEALRPPAPAEFRPLLLERLGHPELLTPAQRMIMRNLERKPLRAASTVAGIAGAAAILISGVFWSDAFDYFIDVQFKQAQRAAVSLGFAEPLSRDVRHELERLPGVLQAEVTRVIPARLRAGQREYRTAITGVADGSRLLRALDAGLREVAPLPQGAILTSRLAARLGVRPGDWITAELLEGKRLQARVRVAAAVDEMAGMNAWMRLEDLNALAREGAVVSGAGLVVDRADEPRLLERLKEMPAAAVVIVTQSLLDTFRATSARNLLFFTSVLTVFAATIAVGVVYNNARIQLAERAWELASLRVLGFTRREVSLLLLGELTVEILLALPLGCLAGYALAALIVWLMPHEVFEFPMVIYPTSYLYAVAIVAAAGIVSALIVRRHLDRLDLVAVLKVRE